MRARATQAAPGRLAAEQRAQPAASEISTVRIARALLQLFRRLLLQPWLRPRERADDVLLQDLCSTTNISRRVQSKRGVSAKRRVAGRRDDIERGNREAARRSRRSYIEVRRLLRCPAEVLFDAPQDELRRASSRARCHECNKQCRAPQRHEALLICA